jgi:hypothetical protein
MKRAGALRRAFIEFQGEGPTQAPPSSVGAVGAKHSSPGKSRPSVRNGTLPYGFPFN